MRDFLSLRTAQLARFNVIKLLQRLFTRSSQAFVGFGDIGIHCHGPSLFSLTLFRSKPASAPPSGTPSVSRAFAASCARFRATGAIRCKFHRIVEKRFGTRVAKQFRKVLLSHRAAPFGVPSGAACLSQFLQFSFDFGRGVSDVLNGFGQPLFRYIELVSPVLHFMRLKKADSASVLWPRLVRSSGMLFLRFGG